MLNSQSAIRNPQSRALLYAPQVLRAFSFIEATDGETHDEMIRICEIPAPPFKEHARAAYLKGRFEELGLKRVRADAEGNIIAERPGRASAPHVIISAHLDTVFPEGTDVRVRRDGVRYYAPGISDNTAGVISLITLARALD
ncbi:MAG TPA: M28 family peptidase, partial [Blastocatellia bacterium]|nr:M28 family peptidase [Blastocatellia bacterium]